MKIMDVTLRESVYFRKGLSCSDALKYLEVLKENISPDYIQFVEIGYLNNDIDAPLNYDVQYFDAALNILDGMYKPTAMMHIQKADIKKWDSDLISRLALVRIVIGHHVPDEIKEYVDYIHALGVKVSANLTYISGLTDDEIRNEINRAKLFGVDYFFCADSSGSLSYKETQRISRIMLDNCGEMSPGMHLHDHMGMATSNALVARDNGIEITDVSITGAGKGGGNLKMEQGLLLLSEKKEIDFRILSGLENLIVFFSELIGRDGDYYVSGLIDFLTGVYRLRLNDTNKLESESNMIPKEYFRLLLERYNPFFCE